MTYQVIAPFKVKTSAGDLAFSQGQIIKLKEDNAAVLLRAGKIKKQHDDIKPFPSEWLKRFDEKTLERLAIMTVDGGLCDEDAQMEIVRPETDMTSSWPPVAQALMVWFMELEPPTAPFYLEPHIHVINPEKFFSSLKMNIKAGPNGPRGRNGGLMHDLINLKKIL